MEILNNILHAIFSSGSYIFYFFLTLTIVVIVHELGHFLTAVMFKMRVERFSLLGLGPPIRMEPLFARLEGSRLVERLDRGGAFRRFLGRLTWLRRIQFSKTVGETEYCICWVPFGGYVKIAGMIDESLDKETIGSPPQPWEFRSRPAWQRFVVLVAGVTMNFLLAVLIFASSAFIQGKAVQETTTVGYVVEESPLALAGLRSGDTILSINGQQVSTWEEVMSGIYVESHGQEVRLMVSRDGREQLVLIPPAPPPDLSRVTVAIVPALTSVQVTAVDPGRPADVAGLKPGDVLVKLDTIAIRYDAKVRETVRAFAGRPMAVEWKRGDSTLQGTVTPTEEGRIGIAFRAKYDGPTSRIEYSLFGGIAQGFTTSIGYCRLIIESLWLAIVGKTSVTDSVGGPLTIAQVATQYASYGILAYLDFLAMLSLSLAVFNILIPIPVLDGGQVLLLGFDEVYRRITGRTIKDETKLKVLQAGMVLVLALMVFALFIDIKRFF